MKIDALPLAERLRLLENVNPVMPKANTEISGGEASGKANGQSFTDFLTNQLKDMNDLALEGEKRLEAHVQGKAVNPHETYIALQKADISFQLLMQVKRQLQQAYQQIIRTPIG
jgi:flagellar hook-basal body complex protein FliE